MIASASNLTDIAIPQADLEGSIDKSLGTKEALAVRLRRKLAIDGEKTLQWVAELAYRQSFQV